MPVSHSTAPSGSLIPLVVNQRRDGLELGVAVGLTLWTKFPGGDQLFTLNGAKHVLQLGGRWRGPTKGVPQK